MLGYPIDTPITTTTFKNKDKMNAINNEIEMFDKKKLKKAKLNGYVSIHTQIKNFDKTKLNKIYTEDTKINILSISVSTIEYEFSFSSDSDSDYPVYTIEEFVNNGLIMF